MAFKLGARRWTLAVSAAALALAAGVSAYGQSPVRIAQKEGAILVQAGERLLMEYQTVANPRKAYVKQLATPGGVNVLRDSPADHKHHHGLMFAVAVDGIDFWSENDACGREVGRPVKGVKASSRNGAAKATFTQAVDWSDPRGEKTLMEEERTVDLCQLPDAGATLLTWQCRLSAPAGKDAVTLSGSPYFGLGMRFLVSMDSGGHFQNADGKTGVQDTNNARSAWCAYSATADGKPVTVAVFDDKSNPRHPATWFTMEKFAYVSATLNLSKEPLKIESGKPLVLRYGVALWDGKTENAQIEQLYQRWLAGAGK
jgi:hypothetical protein